jgi:3-methyladenine DNA glycosylase AlkD
MTADDIVKQLELRGATGYKKILHNHGIPEPVYGVKIEYLKKIHKQVKKDYQLALDLFETGIYDARYLAGLIADEAKMTKKDLQRWADTANCDALTNSTVAWVTAESKHGRELALKWIESKKPNVAATGWATLGSLVALTDDADLDIAELKALLLRVQKCIHQQPDNVRYVMNHFVISVGSYVKALTTTALQTAAKIGEATVHMGNTACKVPSAAPYIKKVQQRGSIGKKRKTVRC